MLKVEKRYEFRNRLRETNKKGGFIRSTVKADNEFALYCGAILNIPDDRVIYTAARDFADFMFTTMETPILLSSTPSEGCAISISVDPSYRSYKAYKTETSPEGIRITAHDARGAAQALFRLEDIMSARHAPYIPYSTEERAPMYSPRMVHSGYGLDTFPDEHLLQIAKAGMDAIIVFAKGANETPRGYLDFNELVCRAALHGLDVYVYSYMRVFVHPDDPDARSAYDNTYGKLFRSCPGIKGVVLVGESVGFPTKDPKAAPLPFYKNTYNGIPTGKPSADMWPCLDYCDWLNMLKGVIYEIKPDADIVFWTYNWGGAPKEDRLALLRTLPTDISLLVTYETFHKYPIGDAVGQCADYTISFEGPGEYFTSEAEVAKERGIRLYAMTNTAGSTWDFGTVPFIPVPYQWIRRYATMKECHDKYGLCGIMESHHFGFWPSFVSETAKEAFEFGGDEPTVALKNAIRRHYGDENADKIDLALSLWSEAIRHHVPSNEDQYGGFRIGPAYPFNLIKTVKITPVWPSDGVFAMPRYPLDNVGKSSLSAHRIGAELESLKKMLALAKEGLKVLETVTDPNEELEYLLNFGRYLVCFIRSGIGAKEFYRCAQHIPVESDPCKVLMLVDEAEAILKAEHANCLEAIEYAKLDSRLGWEPRMEYCGAPEQIEWKIKHLEYVIGTELNTFRRCARFSIDDENIATDTFI